MKACLIIGGGGLLGRAVAGEFLRSGWSVATIRRGIQEPVPGAEALRADRNDSGALRELLSSRSFDATVDCIAYEAHQVDALRAAGGERLGRYILISTDLVYAPPESLPIDEEHPLRPAGGFARGKMDCESLLRRGAPEGDVNWTILRPTPMLGAGAQLGTGGPRGGDPQLLSRLDAGVHPVLLDGGSLLIQPVHQLDVAGAARAAAEAPSASGATYNVAGPDCVTTRRYYELIAATLALDLPEPIPIPSALFASRYPEQAGLARHRCYDISALDRDAGFRPSVGLAAAIFETVDYLQAEELIEEFEEDEVEGGLTLLWEAYLDAARSLLDGGDG